jgi:hypothetical protein
MKRQPNKDMTSTRSGAPAEKRAGKGTARRVRESAQPSTEQATEFKFRPVTFDQAEALVDRFIGTDDDEAALSFIRLLNGLVHERYAEDGDVEGLARVAATRAYMKTIHSEAAFEEFSMLDPERIEDRRSMYPGVAGMADVADVGTVG